MNLFALDTSGFSASLALTVAGETLQVELGAEEKTAQFLIPRIHELLESTGLSPQDIDRFAVTTGPGSFTGIRIGMTTIKTMAYALGAKIAGVNSLAAIAESANLTKEWTSSNLTVMINAFRRQIFVCQFHQKDFSDQALNADKLTRVVPLTEIENLVQQQEGQIVGPGCDALPAELKERLQAQLIPLQRIGNPAIGVGSVGNRLYDCNRISDAISLVPNYFRGSAAEEKLLTK